MALDEIDSENYKNGSVEVQTEISANGISHVKRFNMDEQEALATDRMFCFINSLGNDDLNSIYKEDGSAGSGKKDNYPSTMNSPLFRRT